MVLLDKKGQKKQSLLDWFLGKKPKELSGLPKTESPAEKTMFQVQPSTEVIMLPELKDVTTLDVRYPLIPPYAYAHIYWNPKESELVYELEEPVLNEQEKQVLKTLEDGIRELINISFLNIKETNKIIEYLEKNLRVLLTEYKITITKETFLKMMYYLYRNFVGVNEIEPLMNDYFIEDVECNGSQTPIYIVHRKYRHIRTNIIFPDNKVLMSFVEKLAQKCGKYVSYASPLLDGALPDGSIDYEEPIIYKEDGIVKISKIGEFVDKYYKNNESNKPVSIKGVEVPAFDQKTLKISWKKLEYVYRHRINEDLFELQLEFGRKIRLTGYHSIFSLTKNGVISERTDKLKVGDYAAIPLTIPENDVIKEINVAEELSKISCANELIIDNIPESIFNTKKQEIKKYLNKTYKWPYQSYYEHKKKKILPLKLYSLLEEKDLRNCKIRPASAVGLPTFIEVGKELIQTLGLYAAEGWTSKIGNRYSIYFSLNKKETDLIETIKNSAKKCFNLDVYVEPEDKNAVKIQINSYVLWILFNDVLKVSKGAKQKRIPELIFNINKELQQEFLKYWSLGDYGSTASKNLADDISYLSLFNEDVVAFYGRERGVLFEGVRKVKSYEYYTNFFARDTNKPYPNMIPTSVFNPLKGTNRRLKSNNRISKKRLSLILNKKRYKRFMDLKNANSIKFLKEWTKRGFIKDNKLTEKGEELLKEIEVADRLTQSDLGFAKIKSVSRVKSSNDFVYDLSIKDHENFIGGYGGICCHNSRVNATYTTDISSRGPTFSIRKFTKEPWTPIKLMDFGTVSPEVLAYLWLLIEHEANMMVIGGTGSGKTSFLNSLAFFIPPAARIITIEDTRELNLLHENWLPSVARAGVGMATITGERHGEVSLFDLLRESFRQRPDYVIVGEIRGKEAFVLFQGAASIKGDEKVLVLNDEHPKRIAIKDLKKNVRYKAVTIDPENGKVNILPVKFQIKHEPRSLLYKITTEKGREVVVTPDHSVFSYDNKITPFRAEELKAGDNIIIPSRIPCGYADIDYINLIEELADIRIYAPSLIREAVKRRGYDKCCEICGIKAVSDYYANFTKNEASALKAKKFITLMKHAKINYNIEDLKVRLKYGEKINPKLRLNKEFLKLIGYYLSEGSLNESGRNSKILFYNKDKEVLHDIRKCIKKVIGREPRKRLITRGYGTCTELCFSSKILCEFIKKNFGKKEDKRIADFIFGLSKEKIGWLLSGLWAGDGEMTRRRFGYYTISKDLANDVSQLLLVYGIVCNISKRKRTGRTKEDYELLFYSREEKERFLEYVKPVNKKVDLSKLRKIRSKKIIINNICVDKIKSISKINLCKEEPVYDISVPGTQNFIGGFGGVMLHNSGHPTMSTMHAESVDTMIKRLETPPIDLSPALVETLNIVCVMVQTKVGGKPVRRLKEVVEIISVPSEGNAVVNTPFVRDPARDLFFYKTDSKMLDKISEEHGIPKQTLLVEWQRRINLLMALYHKKMFGFKEVYEVINQYYKTPQEVLRRFGIK